MPNVSLGFPEYGMTNASNVRCGIPPSATEKGAFIYGNDANAKNSVNSPCFPAVLDGAFPTPDPAATHF